MSLLIKAALAAVVLASSAVSAAPVAYAIADGGRTLVRIADLSKPAAAVRMPLAGLAAPLAAIAWRPMTGELYGYGGGTVHMIETASGTATPLVSLDPATGSAAAGFDFNNRIDAARVVSSAGDNLVFDPKKDPATLARFTALFYGEADPNKGTAPQVFANAYTNAVPNAQSTVQYVLDAATGSLATLANNEGKLATVGRLMLDGKPLTVTTAGDMDIVSAREGDNRAYALLTTSDGSALYRLPLEADGQGRILLEKLGPAPAGAFGLVVFEPGSAPLVR